MAKSDFLNQMQALNFQIQELADDFFVFPFMIPVGKFRGQAVKMGLQVHDSFPINPPPGPHFSPLLMPVTGGGGCHPFGAIHPSALGPEWEYWSRPFKDWNRTDKTAKTYLAH